MVQSEMIEKRKAEKMLRSKKKSSNENEVNRESDATLSSDEEMSSSTAETSSLMKSNTAKSDYLLLNKKSEDAKRHSEDHRMQQSDSDGVMSLADDHLGGEDAGRRDEPSNVQEVDEYQCVCESRLSLWRRFSEVEPLLEMPNKPLNVADVPSSSLTSHPEMDKSNHEQTPPIASSSVLEQDLFLSPSKATLDDSLGLSLSPSVSVDSLLSPDNTLNCVQDRILSESLLVDEMPSSRRDVVASSSDELRSHRRRTQSSCGQQREECSDDQIKLRSRSISIAVVSGRDYKRTASWEIPEGSHSPSLTSYQKSTLSRSAERNEKLKREEKSVLTRSLLFKKHQRLLSYSGTRSQEMIRTEHSHLQRRTMSCSIEDESPMKVPVSPAKKSRTRRYSLRSVHEYRSESTITSLQPSSPIKALPSNISALSPSSMKKVVTDEENNERMSSAESKNDKQELCEDVTRTLNGSDDDDVTTLSTLSPSTNEVMNDEHNNEKMSTTKSKSEKQGLCDEVAHLSPSVESPKTLNGPDDDGVRNVSILSSKCIDIT
ncbi:unnamed protein product, partial [Anisakis simplex]|uniref:Dentin sialophosphoprotein-like n=1 Tax=Anisakis simplex TaxID=6269 RepID=A0A0M3J220_ANISI